MSQCIKKWKVGTHIEVRGPFGSLQYSANKVLVYQVLAILIWIHSWTSIHRLCWSFIVAMGFWSICYIILCLQLAGKGFAAFKCIYTNEKKNQNRINKNERKNFKNCCLWCNLKYILQYRKLILLTAGTGIAPMSQIIQGILGNEEDDTMIQMFYACKSYNQILMKTELDDWSSFWNFSVTYVLSQVNEIDFAVLNLFYLFWVFNFLKILNIKCTRVIIICFIGLAI